MYENTTYDVPSNNISKGKLDNLRNQELIEKRREHLLKRNAEELSVGVGYFFQIAGSSTCRELLNKYVKVCNQEIAFVMHCT